MASIRRIKIEVRDEKGELWDAADVAVVQDTMIARQIMDWMVMAFQSSPRMKKLLAENKP